MSLLLPKSEPEDLRHGWKEKNKKKQIQVDESKSRTLSRVHARGFF